MSVPDEGYSRSASCALNLISTILLSLTCIVLFDNKNSVKENNLINHINMTPLPLTTQQKKNHTLEWFVTNCVHVYVSVLEKRVAITSKCYSNDVFFFTTSAVKQIIIILCP